MKIDGSKADLEMVKQVVDEGQAFLDGQLKIAISADQRASVLAGVFATSGAAVIAALISLTTIKEPPFAKVYPLYVAGFFTSVMFVGAAALCVYAIFPVKFRLPGNHPASWEADLESGRDLKASLCETLNNIQKDIVENDTVIERNASLFRRGAAIGIAAPVVGAVAWLLSFLPSLLAH